MPYLSQTISMNLVLQLILKLLSRPVVCFNFQGLEANTFFQLSESIKATVQLCVCCNTHAGPKKPSKKPWTKKFTALQHALQACIYGGDLLKSLCDLNYQILSPRQQLSLVLEYRSTKFALFWRVRFPVIIIFCTLDMGELREGNLPGKLEYSTAISTALVETCTWYEKSTPVSESPVPFAPLQIKFYQFFYIN